MADRILNEHAGTYLEDAKDEDPGGDDAPQPVHNAHPLLEDALVRSRRAAFDQPAQSSQPASVQAGSSPIAPVSRRHSNARASLGQSVDDQHRTPDRQDNFIRPSEKEMQYSESREKLKSTSKKEEQDSTESIVSQPVENHDASQYLRQKDAMRSVEDKTKTGVDENIHARSARFRITTQLYIISELVFFSFLGTLARLGTQWLTFYPGAPVVFSNLWANVGGTFIMGFLLEDCKLFAQEWGRPKPFAELYPIMQDGENRRSRPSPRAKHLKAKKTIPLYISLTVGFCGSYTSFSSFQRDIFYALANKLPTPFNHSNASPSTSLSSTIPRNNAYSVTAVLAIILLTIATCYTALLAGAALASAFDRITPTLPFHFQRNILEPVLVFLAWTAWLGAIILAIFPPDRPGGPSSRGPWSHEAWRGEVLFALVFAPLGCLLRYLLSIKLNSLLVWFPLGTFTANMFGTAVLGVCLDLQHVALSESGVGGGIVGCQVLQGVQDGFCGCLTTVSTWIVEVQGLRRRHAWFYGGASVGVGMAFCVVIMGSVLWSIGWGPVVCVVSNVA